MSPASVVVWDSQVKDSYKRSQTPAAVGKVPKDSPTSTAPAVWDGKKTGVVEELLQNASDKAYGAKGEYNLTPLRNYVFYTLL